MGLILKVNKGKFIIRKLLRNRTKERLKYHEVMSGWIIIPLAGTNAWDKC